MSTVAEPSGSPTPEQWSRLCRDVQTSLLPEAGAESWYLLIATVLTASPRPELLAGFWGHLTEAEFSTVESKGRLSARLGDLLLKQITLVGAPQVLSALIPLARRQGEVEERGELDTKEWSELSFPRLHARGVETITSVYGSLWPDIFRAFGPHRKVVGFHELAVVYGLYLSDFTHLTPLETELLAYTCITCQGLRGPALWHVRGLGRVLGARGGGGGQDETDRVARVKQVVRSVRSAVAAAVEFCGAEMVRRSRLDRGWPDVDDVVAELGGWGDDDDDDDDGRS